MEFYLVRTWHVDEEGNKSRPRQVIVSELSDGYEVMASCNVTASDLNDFDGLSMWQVAKEILTGG